MVRIVENEALESRQIAVWFRQNFLSEQYRTLDDSLPSGVTRIGQLANLYEAVDRFISQCTVPDVERKYELADDLLPCLKRILIVKRRREANYADVFTERTHNQFVIDEIEKNLRKIERFLEAPWLTDVVPLKLPQISEFLSIESIQGGFQMHQLAEREFDEKFHILQAPKLMLKDLAYFREMCQWRGVPVIVVYLDIDYFKRFNTEYGETVIDRRVLPVFMRTLEAQVFHHGFAYREGGDEYMMILPNLSKKLANNFLESLRETISALDFDQVEYKMTVSIGFCCVDYDCALTDREIKNMANKAKSFAKSNGRNCIATYSSSSFQESDLIIVGRADS